MPRLGFGCGLWRIINAAFNRVVTFIDTSYLYGHNHDNGIMVGKVQIIQCIFFILILSVENT